MNLYYRHMGTITGISDLDAVRWKNSQWRNLQVKIVASFLFIYSNHAKFTSEVHYNLNTPCSFIGWLG